MTDNKLISITAQQGDRLDRISGVSDSLSKKLFDLGITHRGSIPRHVLGGGREAASRRPARDNGR